MQKYKSVQMIARATRTMAPPEKLVDVDVSMRPEPTTGGGGAAGVLLLVPMFSQLLHLTKGMEILNC